MNMLEKFKGYLRFGIDDLENVRIVGNIDCFR